MDQGADKKGKAKVIDFAHKKYTKLVLQEYDKLERDSKRESNERRAEVERVARNRL